MPAFHSSFLVLYTWPALLITLLLNYFWGSSAFFLSLAFAGLRPKFPFYKEHILSFLLLSLGVDALGVLLLVVLSLLGYFSPSVKNALALDHVEKGNLWIAIYVVTVVLFCGFLKYYLSKNVLLKKTKGLPSKKKAVICSIFAVMTVPWTGLFPIVLIYDWLGKIMVLLGGLADITSFVD